MRLMLNIWSGLSLIFLSRGRFNSFSIIDLQEIKNQYLSWKKTYPQLYDTRLENESGERFLLEWMEWARR